MFNFGKIGVLGLLAVLVLAQAQIRDPHPDIRRVPADGKIEIHSDDQEESKKLSCFACCGQDAENFRWFRVDPKDGKTELNEVTSTEAGAEVNKGELTLESSSLENGEVFRCKLADQIFADFEIVDLKNLRAGSKQFRVEKFPRSFNVIENDDLKINCFVLNRTAEGFDISEIAIKWFKWEIAEDLEFETIVGNCSRDSIPDSRWVEIEESSGESDKEEPHYKFLSRDGLSKAILKIEDAIKSDRRGFKCLAYNITASSEDTDCSESVAFVRVKDKLAALWPFLGIVAEVVVLSVFILIVERRRANNKDLEEEEEEDENGVGVAGANSNSDKNSVRQRK